MNRGATAELTSVLEKSKAELGKVSGTIDHEIESVALTFANLADEADTILQLAGTIVGRVEGGKMSAVLSNVHSLCATVKDFIVERLEATTRILEAVTTELKLLGQLSGVTRGQAAIALQTKALSVLTNIEVARLGSAGTGFQYLAQELSDFSRSVSKGTQELAQHTEGRKSAIEEMKQVLSADLPRLRKELERTQEDLTNASAAIGYSLDQLSSAPGEFKACVEKIAGQVGGVITAVQAHDITRQQLEHVHQGLDLISSGVGRDANSGNGAGQRPRTYAGLMIQIGQLKAIRETLVGWTAQIKTCMEGILRVSTSEVVALGPLVLDQEREVSSQLAHIERVQGESQAYGARIQHALAGLSSLLQLVSEHLERSKSIRDHLQLLTFNSIIEASRLNGRADAILAVAGTVKGVSSEWNALTDQSALAREEIVKLVERTSELAETLSESGNARLRQDQAQTADALESVRAAATLVDREARQMGDITGRMHARIGDVRRSAEVLASSFACLDSVIDELEQTIRRLELEDPSATRGYDTAEMEQLFGASYTTESERRVLEAVLRGTALPLLEASFAGNSVELF